MKRALAKMVEDVVVATKDCEHRILAISHCNCPERAQYVKACLEKLARFKKIVIVDTARSQACMQMTGHYYSSIRIWSLFYRPDIL